MTLWDELVGQDSAVALMKAAAQPGSQAMTHAWLVTGPPGSGRSTLAHAFAAELVGAGLDAARWKRVIAGAHPDVSILATDRVTITIEEVRALVSFSYFSPSQAPYRVVVIEDADRMTDRTSPRGSLHRDQREGCSTCPPECLLHPYHFAKIRRRAVGLEADL